MSLFPILLAIHVTLAVALLLPSVIVPFLLRPRTEGAPVEPSRFASFLLRVQSSGSIVISIGLAVTGVAMLTILGPALLGQPWLLVAIGLYAANLLVAALISRPSLRRLIGLRDSRDPEAWRRRARRQRLLAYLMAGVIGVIAMLMSTKPQLW
jgi:hypothetical protein